eukprot:34426-Amphidinium_carterae.1
MLKRLDELVRLLIHSSPCLKSAGVVFVALYYKSIHFSLRNLRQDVLQDSAVMVKGFLELVD